MMYLERKKLQLMLNRKFRGYLKTATGNSITLEDCTDDYPSSVSVSGMTYQGNPDDNYLDILDVWDNPNGTTLGGYKYKYIKLKPNTTYTLSTNAPATKITSSGWYTGLFSLYSGKNATTWYWNTQLGHASYDNPVTWSTDAEGYLTITILYSGGDINVIRDDLANGTYWVMLSEGGSALEYKPYTELSSINPKEMFSCGEKTSNIFNVNNRNMVTAKKYSVDKDGWVTIEHDNTNGSSTSIPAYCTYRSMTEIKPNTAYKVITEIKEASNCKICSVTTNNTDPSQFVKPTVIRGVTGTFIEDVTSVEDFSKSSYMLRTLFYIPANTIGKIVFRISLVEDTTITEDTFVYEPYRKYKVSIEQSQNLYNVQDRADHMNNLTYWSVDDEDYITINFDNSTGTGTKYPQYFTKPSSDIKPNRLYTIITEIKEINNATLNTVTSSLTLTGQFKMNKGYSSTGTHKLPLVTKPSLSDASTMLRTECQIPAGKIGKVVFRISVFEGNLSTPTEDFVYEPYCGKTEKYNIYVPEQLYSAYDDTSVNVLDTVVVEPNIKKATLYKKLGKVIYDGSKATNGGDKFWNTQIYSLFNNNVARFRMTHAPYPQPKQRGGLVSNYFNYYKNVWAGSLEGCRATEARSIDVSILHSTLEKYYPDANGEYGIESTIATYNEILANETVGEKTSNAYKVAAQKAFGNWLVCMNEQGTPLTFIYELETPIETDISDLQDWDSISKLNKGRNIIVAESIERPSSIEVTYYSNEKV